MRQAWELVTAGPEDAAQCVLLLPGGANAARSFDLVMAEPVLAGVRLVATTLPGMAGAPVSGDTSVPAMARRVGELAEQHRCDVLVGFSHGATDDYGYEAVEGKVHIHDWHATILHLLGLNHEKLTYRYAGRDMRLTDVKGNVVREIIG